MNELEPSGPEMARMLRRVTPRKPTKLRLTEETADLVRPVYTALQERLRRGEPYAWTKWKREIEPICRQLEQQGN